MQATSEHMNPYSAPAVTFDPLAAEGRPTFGGVNRSQYITWTIASWILNCVVLRILAPHLGAYAQVVAIGFLLFQIGVIFYLVAQRHINLGYSPYWAIGMLIPLVNLFVGVRCMVFPEGYAHHRRLDGVAWIMLSPVVIVPALLLLSMFNK